MTLREFVEMSDKRVVALFEKAGEVMPLYHVIMADGQELVFPEPQLPDRDLMAAVTRRLFEALGVTRYVYINEAWTLETLTHSKEEAAKMRAEADAKGVSAMPGRKEVLMYSAEDEAEPMVMAWREIIRDGDKATCGPLQFFDPEGSEGRRVGLLPRKGRLQ